LRSGALGSARTVQAVFDAVQGLHGGQTLGMRAWKLQLQNMRPGPISWWQVLLRFMVALLSALLCGLGYLWMLIDKQKLTWHDRYSETRVVQLPENPHAR